MTARRLIGKSGTGGAGGAGSGGGAVSAAVSCRVSRLRLNPRQLIFQQKYRGSAKRPGREMKPRSSGVERR